VTLLGTEFGPDERRKQLDEAARTLDDVARKVKANGDSFEKRLTELERSRAHMVRAKRDYLLSMHGHT
jgi:hypothetical protein